MIKLEKRANSGFFYKIFTVITLIILVCSSTVSLLIYYRFNSILSKQDRNFIVYTSNQVKSEIINLTKDCELIAGNIYSDNSIQILLNQNYYRDMDYSLFEIFNMVSNSFQGIKQNNQEISSISIYELAPGLITNGREIRNSSEFKRQDLIEKAIQAHGGNVWATYTDDDGTMKFCLLKYLNLYKPGGVLVIELKEESFLNLYKPIIGGKNSLFIIDQDHNIISSNQGSSIGKNINTILKGDLPESASVKEISFDKTSYFFYTDKIKDVWSIVILYNSYEIEKGKRDMAYYALALTGVFIIIGLLLSSFIASRFASQVDRLMKKIKEIERGNLKIQPDQKMENEFHRLDKTLCIMAQNIDRLNTDVIEAVKQKKESDIKYLQMQMNPHFLYNILSVIRWIAYNNSQIEIMSIVDNLSNFYRIALSKGNEIIEISSEISLIKCYIELQNMCCNPPIKLDICIDDELMNMKINKMTLQPFIENSVVHGRVGDRVLDILVYVSKTQNGAVRIAIEDDGNGIPDDIVKYIESLNRENFTMDGMHYGISNTFARLKLLYNSRVTIHASRKSPGTSIELIIDSI